MTSSSIPTIFMSTNSTFRKYSTDSVLTDFLPMQTNGNSTSLPANTSDICCHLKASPWPCTSPDHPRLANSMKSQGHSIIPRLCQYLPLFHLWILQNHSPAHTSYLQGYPLEFLQ